MPHSPGKPIDFFPKDTYGSPQILGALPQARLPSASEIGAIRDMLGIGKGPGLTLPVPSKQAVPQPPPGKGWLAIVTPFFLVKAFPEPPPPSRRNKNDQYLV